MSDPNIEEPMIAGIDIKEWLAMDTEIKRLRDKLEAIQDYRLQWGMACQCSCKACDAFFNAIRDIDD